MLVRRIPIQSWWFLLGIVLLAPKPIFAQEIDKNAAAILQLWEAREEKMKSGRIVWKEKATSEEGDSNGRAQRIWWWNANQGCDSR